MKLKQRGSVDLVDGKRLSTAGMRNGWHPTLPSPERLRIGMIAPPWFTIPPKGYGGIERVVALLTEGLAARGHEVTLFAPGGSETAASLTETFPEPMYRQIGSIAVETLNTLSAYSDWKRFDVFHDHTVSGLGVASFVDRPIVHTVHGAVLPDIRQLYASLPSNVHLIAISENQRTTLPEGAPATVIWNSMDLTGVEWSRDRGDYLLFTGRAAPEKGPMEALKIAERTGMPLRMLLKVNEPPEQEYFEMMRPECERLGVQVELDVTEAEKQRAFAGAYATLFPISWEEPFGLVMIESMAGGTPVIAYSRGSVPEVIEHGVTGFVCHELEEAIEAVQQVESLDRAACRQRVESVFSAEAAIDQHEQLFRSLVGARPRARSA